MQTIACHKCGHSWEFEPPLGRREECPACGADARVCRNCVMFDQGSYRECREPQASWVKEKDVGNFCGYFTPSGSRMSQAARLSEERSKLESFFKGQGSDPGAKKPGASMADELEAFLKGKGK